MKQVAEALKKLQVDGKWTPEAIEAFDAIKPKAWDRDLVILDGYEIDAVLNAIISIYG